MEKHNTYLSYNSYSEKIYHNDIIGRSLLNRPENTQINYTQIILDLIQRLNKDRDTRSSLSLTLSTKFDVL